MTEQDILPLVAIIISSCSAMLSVYSIVTSYRTIRRNKRK